MLPRNYLRPLKAAERSGALHRTAAFDPKRTALALEFGNDAVLACQVLHAQAGSIGS